VQIWNDKEKYSIRGEHRVEDIFEHLSDQYFSYKDMTIEDLTSMTDEIIKKTQAAVLEAVDKEFDSSF
jgi:DNA anti-recombination protein RmuC